MEKVFKKLPYWAMLLILVPLQIGCNYFVVMSGLSTFGELYDLSDTLNKVSLAIGIIFSGLLSVGLIWLFSRIIYSLADRVFFRSMRMVPDYNLRHLPIPYSHYLKWVAVWVGVRSLVGIFTNCLLPYLVPTGYFIWRFLDSVVRAFCFILAYVCMSKGQVPAWQASKCLIAFTGTGGLLIALSILFY